jgi:hypothetical protein
MDRALASEARSGSSILPGDTFHSHKKMSNPIPKIRSRVLQRGLLWGLVALYTFLIPNAIYLYRFIEAKYGSVFAGKIPLVLVIISGIAYMVFLRLSKMSWKKILYTIPCAVVIVIIFKLESNPNKNIHIPEYVLLAWLVYAALSRDYQGKGIFILIFIITSMLGFVDELEQGIHPGRFYGLSDMMVNSSSALIGVFTILGTTKLQAATWGWTGYLKKYKLLLWVILFGFAGAVLMCVHLFEVQAGGGIFRGVYPVWLLIWNVLFVVVAPLIFNIHRNTIQKQKQIITGSLDSTTLSESAMSQLWIYPILTILFYMHVLLVYVSISGVIFK